MIRSSFTNAIVAVVIASAATIVAAPIASANVMYDWSVGTGTSGTFTTGAVSPIDSNFFLLTAFTVTQFTDTTLGSIPVNLVNDPFNNDQAFDPTTSAFEIDISNHIFTSVGINFTGTVNGVSSDFNISAFNSGFDNLSLTDNLPPGSTHLFAQGNFSATAVPEPSTLFLLAGALFGLGVLSSRRASGRSADGS